ncbi:bucky ball-like [Hoplias malabaricus]|uniref:bucky ball-like n=1 Tax=Hoplias malabaricus TaxID=27720 RepID=UPI003463493E
MDEPSKTSQPGGSGQSHQRPVNHSRPFFYIQPPLQSPFYTYQWHMNNPYNHNVPGAGFHFGRPCMMPYSYLQYPGYVMPHAAMYPVDFRRIYERNFPPAAPLTPSDFGFRQHQHSGPQRETTCAGAQTDPCEALNKLIECLDQLRAGEELHPRVDSLPSGMHSPQAEGEKSEEQIGTCPGKTVTSSVMVEPGTEASGKHINQEEDWPVGSGNESSLDESSVQEECGEITEEEHDYLHQDDCVQSPQKPKDTEIPNSSQEKNKDEKALDRRVPGPSEEKEWNSSNANWPSSQSSPLHPCSNRTSESQATDSAQHHPTDISGDYSCCILHLPFEKVLNASVYGPGSTPRSLGSPFSYSYCPPKLSHERVSVLSPSLDELSSHDELLSTDPEDIALFPTRIYTRGKLTEVTSKKSHSDIHTDMCVLYPKRLTCAVCGSNAFKECSKPKAFHCETHCYGGVDDSDEEALEAKSVDWEVGKTCKHCLRGTMLKQTAKKTHPLTKCRLKHREKLAEFEGKSGQTDASCTEHICCEKCMSSPEKSIGHSARGISTRPFKERRCRPLGIMPDQVVCENAGVNARTKTCRAQPLPQRQERMGQRKSHLKPKGSRNDNIAADGDDDEEDEGEEKCQEKPQFHRGKGAAKGGGARC